MPLLTDQALERVVQLLQKRHVFLYHACQLTDFGTYVELGGIPSRRLMESSGLPYTRFVTDSEDHRNGVWPKVFANLSDFGRGFAGGRWSEERAPIPNPYGPVLLLLRPEALLDAIDVAICLRSAGGRDFSRDAESLSSVEEVDRLFVHPADDPDVPRRSWVKFSSRLREDFGDRCAARGAVPATYTPEISCTMREERLPLAHLSHIVVDRYYMDDRSLFSRVCHMAYPGGLGVETQERRYREGRRDILSDLPGVLRDGVVKAGDLGAMVHVSPHTRHWAGLLILGNLEWQYERFAKYLREGTILPACDLPHAH